MQPVVKKKKKEQPSLSEQFSTILEFLKEFKAALDNYNRSTPNIEVMLAVFGLVLERRRNRILPMVTNHSKA